MIVRTTVVFLTAFSQNQETVQFPMLSLSLEPLIFPYDILLTYFSKKCPMELKAHAIDLTGL